MSSPRLHCSRSIPLAIAGLLVSTAAAVAQTAPCGLDNPFNWCAHQDLGSVSDDAEPNEQFGAALAFGDFNGDGFDDLAVGAPNEENFGAVHVFPGSVGGLTLLGQLFFTQNNTGGADGGAESGDQFGFALAAGDFNGDGFDDLAIGSPGEDLDAEPDDLCGTLECEDTGAFHVVSGSASGLLVASARFLDRKDLIAFQGLRDGAGTGWSLAAAGVNPDNFDDLLVGSPFNSVSQLVNVGDAVLSFGSAAGLNGAALASALNDGDIQCGEADIFFGATLVFGQFDADVNREWLIASPGCNVGTILHAGRLFYYNLPPAPDADFVQTDFSTAGNGTSDFFGDALVAGDFDGNGLDDLAAGAPGKDHGAGNPNDSGRVYVAYSSATGPDPGFFDIIGEDEWDGQTPAAGENFGAELLAADVTGDGIDDLLAGAPGEGAQGGFLFLKPGSTSGLTATGNQVISQGFLGGITAAGDRFGSVLAAGDSNGDGILELAIGVPAKDVGANADAGLVYVTRFFDVTTIFSDGFESGTTAAWSVVVP